MVQIRAFPLAYGIATPDGPRLPFLIEASQNAAARAA